ncbi:MAG: ABC transporter ATP-binding protein [Sedimentisphaerales bacterium]
MNDDVIVIENLVKYFDGRCVLDGINLSVPKGCIYGLLGRNGAGKTTMIRILLGLEPATCGQTFLLGAESANVPAKVRARIGSVAEGHNLIQNYRVARLIKLCKDLSLKWNDEFFGHLIETFRLPTDRRVRELSIGMRAQLNLALAMAIDPELLILDDPTLGLDTVARRQFLELAIEIIQKQGRTILFSSHILSDVERIADRIGILTAGKLVVDCPLEQLKQRVRKLRVIFAESVPTDLYLTEIINRQIEGREMVLTVANWNEQKQALLETFKPSDCTEIPMSLEDIFIECTRPQSDSSDKSDLPDKSESVEA